MSRSRPEIGYIGANSRGDRRASQGQKAAVPEISQHCGPPFVHNDWVRYRWTGEVMNRLIASGVLAAVLAVFALQLHGSAQPPGPAVGNGRGPVAPPFMSPEAISDKRVVFRVFAP